MLLELELEFRKLQELQATALGQGADSWKDKYLTSSKE